MGAAVWDEAVAEDGFRERRDEWVRAVMGDDDTCAWRLAHQPFSHGLLRVFARRPASGRWSEVTTRSYMAALADCWLGVLNMRLKHLCVARMIEVDKRSFQARVVGSRSSPGGMRQELLVARFLRECPEAREIVEREGF